MSRAAKGQDESGEVVKEKRAGVDLGNHVIEEPGQRMSRLGKDSTMLFDPK